MPAPIFTTSQSASYDAAGSLERDISPIVTNIMPDKTPFLSSMPVLEDAHEMKIEWHTDELRPAKKNQRPEFDEYTFEKAPGIGRMENYCQIFREDGKVSDVMQKAWKTYTPKTDELSRLITKKSKELAKDMEYALMSNTEANAESGSTLAMMGGVAYFMQEELLSATVDAGTGIVTTTDKHHLDTGRWVMFKGDTLPTEIVANKRYYVRLDMTNPDTAFTVFNSETDAIENNNPITFTDAGTNVSVLINNVVDAGDEKFTLENINDAMEMAFMRGGDPTQAWMSASNKRRFSEILASVHTTNRNQTDKRVDSVITTYQTDFGVIEANVHRDCADDVLYILDPSYWGLRYFDRPHMIANDKLPKTGSYEKFVFTGTMSLQATQPLASVAIKNIKRP